MNWRASMWYKQTRAERDSYRNTITLFFGALLGANLGTLNGLSLSEYVFIIGTLLGAVMSLQLINAARSRVYALSVIGLYATAAALSYFDGDLRPTGLSESDFDKLIATLGVWLVATAVVEATPIIDDGPKVSAPFRPDDAPRRARP